MRKQSQVFLTTPASEAFEAQDTHNLGLVYQKVKRNKLL